MICANCHKKVTYGYFWEGESVKYICTDCLLSYRSGKVKVKKYDREQIMRMHEKGYSNETIAAVMGTNRLTIGCIIRKDTGVKESYAGLNSTCITAFSPF